MPKRSSKRPRDLNSLAASIVEDATDEAPEPESVEPDKDPAAVALGRRGGLKGGKARAEKMTAELSWPCPTVRTFPQRACAAR
jgi:hypothetical protein